MAEYINKQDVMNMFYPRPTNIHAVKPLSALIREKIETIPAADVVERKKGKWNKAYLDHEAFGVRPRVWYCSECQQISSFRTFFCSYCGVDMRGEDDV